ncbi:hypothetical protein FOA43_001312 [Brettanomyces nanus]|uniref:Uncharacterized protein n=1 Tax=Eeniella nana TaxID=13502 RepID=A0A875S0Y4_EENNA|nr:uncharacterized protein FOA43_001312 [Brettanomyces nanus]QPG73995.1 hypothetical protein FOA43_001312 [Brettanomyces nanus]
MFGNIAKRLAGKTILITGASAGIGKATAQSFAEASNGDIKLVLAARRLEKLDALRDELSAKYPKLKVYPVILDVSKIETIEPFFKGLPQEFGTIDVLVNNAGKALGLDPIGSVNPKDVDVMFQTNVLGMIQLTQLVVAQMKQRNKGDIIQLGSVAGRNPYPGGGIYCATKAALRSFTHVLREELINTRIRVMEIEPGNVESDEFSLMRFRGDKSRAKKVYENSEPLTQEDIAELVVFAASRRENTVIAESLIFGTNQASAYHLYKGSLDN